LEKFNEFHKRDEIKIKFQMNSLKGMKIFQDIQFLISTFTSFTHYLLQNKAVAFKIKTKYCTKEGYMIEISLNLLMLKLNNELTILN